MEWNWDPCAAHFNWALCDLVVRVAGVLESGEWMRLVKSVGHRLKVRLFQGNFSLDLSRMTLLRCFYYLNLRNRIK